MIGTIIFVIRIAVDTSQIRPNLSSRAYAIANFHSLDILTNLNGLAYDFVSDTDW